MQIVDQMSLGLINIAWRSSSFLTIIPGMEMKNTHFPCLWQSDLPITACLVGTLFMFAHSERLSVLAPVPHIALSVPGNGKERERVWRNCWRQAG